MDSISASCPAHKPPPPTQIVVRYVNLDKRKGGTDTLPDVKVGGMLRALRSSRDPLLRLDIF